MASWAAAFLFFSFIPFFFFVRKYQFLEKTLFFFFFFSNVKKISLLTRVLHQKQYFLLVWPEETYVAASFLTLVTGTWCSKLQRTVEEVNFYRVLS